uniref:EF-hand domain-containing protein n=1 Tax=Plectus sambesii TaxID=2011161 RepID=A0A914UM57_9BILA
MFAARRATLPCFSHQKAPPRRRSSLFQRSVHAHYENHQAPSIFGCWPFDSIIQSVYWTLRSIQFWLCYQIEELEYDYLDTSIPVISTKPPPLNELAHRTKLDKTWLKYMYAKFKEECPNGLMGLPEFKNVFGRYLSQRVGDAYLERMFFAFAKNGCHDSGENITFEDFVETLAAINEKTAESNAEWVWK